MKASQSTRQTLEKGATKASARFAKLRMPRRETFPELSSVVAPYCYRSVGNCSSWNSLRVLDDSAAEQATVRGRKSRHDPT
jgi:hypothetical protein